MVQLDMWLDMYQADDIIEPVTDKQTDRVSGLVVAPKPRNLKQVRVCSDYPQVNQAIKRLPFGVNSASEVFQHAIQNAL